MKVIVKEPGKVPVIKDIPNTLQALQEAVGGYIEVVTIMSDMAVICDEEGRLKGKEPNCSICNIEFVGTVLLVGVDGGEDFVDVPATLEDIGHLRLFKGWIDEHNMNQSEGAL